MSTTLFKPKKLAKRKTESCPFCGIEVTYSRKGRIRPHENPNTGGLCYWAGMPAKKAGK